MSEVDRVNRVLKVLWIGIIALCIFGIPALAENSTSDLIKDLNIGNAKAGYDSLPKKTQSDAAWIGGVVSFILIFSILVVLMSHGIFGVASTVVGEAGKHSHHTSGIIKVIAIAFLVGIAIAIIVYKFLS